MAAGPAERSLKNMRKRGYHAEVVEKWIPRANVRKDLFGFIDIVAVGNGETVGVQSTSYSNISSRRKKIIDSEYLEPLLNSGWRIIIQGWKSKKVGKVKRWECKEEEVKLENKVM